MKIDHLNRFCPWIPPTLVFKTLVLKREGTNRLGQIPRKPAFLKFCRQTRGKVGKHIFLVKNYSLNMKKLFTRPDFEFLTVKLQL